MKTVAEVRAEHGRDFVTGSWCIHCKFVMKDPRDMYVTEEHFLVCWACVDERKY